MPIIKSNYKKKPWYLLNDHFETIIPSLFYKIRGVKYQRERLELEDGDFLDLDWLRGGNKRLMVLSHGLGGSSDRHYIKRPAKYFSNKGWDILAWNNRGCSGEMNRLPRFYHHGATEDIAAVIERALRDEYNELVLVGFSMGGGMQQKYLGERLPDERIKGAISFSVPSNVQDSALKLKEGINHIYENKFISNLKQKILSKAKTVALPVDLEQIKKCKNFYDLDSSFTLKIHTEYTDIEDFYVKISSDQYLPNIKIPLLIVNALNDPMLGEKCMPVQLAKTSNNIYLEIPLIGGHVGFTLPNDKWSYMEYVTDKFIQEIIFSPEISKKPR